MSKRTVDEYGRFTWDEDYFEKKIQARLAKAEENKKKKPEQIKPENLKPLSARTDFADLTKDINKRKIIGENIPISKIGQYTCAVCQLYFKDSNSYLRHLNSPEHNEKCGMSLKLAPVTDEEVFERVDQWESYYTQGITVPPLYKEAEEYEMVEMNEQAQNNEDEQQNE